MQSLAHAIIDANMALNQELSNGQQKTKQMKVLILGLPRTGTTSLCLALRTLGLEPYNFYEIIKNKEGSHFQLWLAAIDAKFDGIGQTFESKDFDLILKDYNAVAASPSWLFAEELIAAYPTAKVILAKRPADAWLRSLQRSAFVVLSWRSWSLVSFMDEYLALHWRLVNRIYFILSQGVPPWTPSAEKPLLEFYERHNSHIRSLVPQENLLEYSPGDGWGPLCEFLQAATPVEEFPHTNAPEDFVEHERANYWSLWLKLGMLVAKLTGPVALMLLALACI